MNSCLSSLFWFNVGKYGVIALLLSMNWLSRQHWLPHRHTGYVSVSGYVHKCSRCGRLPAGAYRAGFHGMEPELPASYTEALRHYSSKQT